MLCASSPLSETVSLSSSWHELSFQILPLLAFWLLRSQK